MITSEDWQYLDRVTRVADEDSPLSPRLLHAIRGLMDQRNEDFRELIDARNKIARLQGAE